MRQRCLLLVAVVACGEATPNGTPETLQPFRPTDSSALQLPITEFAIPSALSADPDLHIATFEGVGTLVGGQGGLFELSSEGFQQIDAQPVHAMVAHASSKLQAGIIVARPEGLFLWRGALTLSPLTMELDGEVLALATRGEDLWLGTATAVYIFSQGELLAFEDRGADRIVTLEGASIVLRRMDDTIEALRETTEAFELKDLSLEIAPLTVQPSLSTLGDELFALKDGALLKRVNTDMNQAAWRAVELNADGTQTVSALATASDGALWVVQDNALHRLDGDQIATMPTSVTVRAALSDGLTLWIFDGDALHRYGGEEAPVSYEKDVVPFSEQNCARCHIELGVAHPLDTYEAWRDEVDQIIEAITLERMPQDGAALIGNVDLINRWKMEGFRR